jgi:hypothetical protein
VWWVSGGNNAGAAGFHGPCLCLGVFLLFVVEGVCVRDCKGLGLCKVSIVGRLAGDECEGGRGNLVTDGGRMRGKGEAG